MWLLFETSEVNSLPKACLKPKSRRVVNPKYALNNPINPYPSFPTELMRIGITNIIRMPFNKTDIHPLRVFLNICLF